MTNSLRIAVLLPSLNEELSVDRTMQAILGGTRVPDEIIVADGHSTDDTLGKLAAWQTRFPALKIVTNELVLPGAGRNAAAKGATADVLIGFDFGNWCDPDYIARMAAPFEADERVQWVAAIFRPEPDSDFEHCVAAIHYHANYVVDRLSVDQRRAMAPAPEQHFPGGMAVAWHRDLWQQAGGMPDWLRAYEDVVFSQKLVAMGARAEVQVEALVHHHVRSTLGEYYRMVRTYTAGRCHAGAPHMHAAKVLLCVVGALAILGVGTIWPPLLFCLPPLIAAYLWRGGINRLVRVERRVPSLTRLWHGICIVLAHDAGMVAGHVRGYRDRWRRPDLKRKLAAYLAMRPAA